LILICGWNCICWSKRFAHFVSCRLVLLKSRLHTSLSSLAPATVLLWQQICSQVTRNNGFHCSTLGRNFWYWDSHDDQCHAQGTIE
jgi:hypothetical protein